MSYREIIEDVQRRTGHKYWLEKISQIANSPTLGGVKPVPNQGFSTAVKLPGSRKFNEIAEPSTYAPSRPLTNNPASDSGYLTGASSLTEDGFNNTNVFEWPIVYSPPILQPSTQDIQPSILDNPFGTLMGKARQLFEQKFDNAMWKAADALTDKWLGIQQQSSKSDPKVEELIKRAEKLLESSKPPDTTPASVHPVAIAATEKDAKTEFNAPDENTQPSATTKQPKDLQKGVNELLGKQKMNKDDAKEPSDSAQFTKKDAASNSNQSNLPATGMPSNATDIATKPVDSTQGESDLKKQSSDEDTDLEKPGEPPKATPIAPPATPVESNSNSASDMKPTPPPATLVTHPSGSIKPAEPHLQEQPSTDHSKSEPKSIVAREVPIKPKVTVVQTVNTPTVNDKEAMRERPGENLTAENPVCGKQVDKETSVEPTVISEAKSAEAKDGTSWDIIAVGAFGAAAILGLTYLEHKKTRSEAQQLEQPSTSQRFCSSCKFTAYTLRNRPEICSSSSRPSESYTSQRDQNCVRCSPC